MVKKKIVWVVDIGDYSTKIIKAKRDLLKNVEILEFILVTEWNKQKVLRGEKKDFVDRLNNFFKAYKKKDEVILLIGDGDLQIDFWTFSALDKEELESVMYWKMQEVVADQLKNWHYDYLARERVDNYKNLGINEHYIDALSVLVSKEMVLNYCKWLKINGKIRLNRVLPQFYGIGQLLKKASYKRAFFLDLGFSKTVLYDFKKGMLVYKMAIVPKKKQNLQDYLETIKRSIETIVQVDQYENMKEKPLLFLIGGASLISEIKKGLKCAEKWSLRSLNDLLQTCDWLKGINDNNKEEIGLFFPVIAALSDFESGV